MDDGVPLLVFDKFGPHLEDATLLELQLQLAIPSNLALNQIGLDNPEELKKLFYRSKVDNSKLYEQLFAVWEVYCTDESLKEVHHAWHTNKCESMNQFITKFVSKSYHLCRTIVGKGCTYLVVSLDSIGYKEYYRTLYQVLKLDYDDTILLGHHVMQDQQKVQKNDYAKLPAVRRRQAAQRAIKIRENIRKVLQDKKAGKSYGSGINDPSKKENSDSGTKVLSKAKRMKTKICPSCKKVGHIRKNHRDCTFSTYSAKKDKGKFDLKNVVVSM
jgi:hypothetical protein